MAGQQTIFLLNGPNANLLGSMAAGTYGTDTLASIRERCEDKAAALDIGLDFRQSNHEGDIIDWIHAARDAACGIIINATSLTYTSIAIMDALKACDKPVIELHLSNIWQREAFRHHSYMSYAATAVIAGLGPMGYEIAVEAMTRLVRDK